MTDVAANHLHAELVDRKRTPLGHVRYWVLAIVGALVHHEGPAVFDLVVIRTATGKEVMRTPADVADPQHLLDTVEDDLETKTVAEFIAEWRVIE